MPVNVVHGDLLKASEDEALCQLYEFAKLNQLSVALPYHIGCGRGGGDRRNVSAMIRTIFTDVQVTLYQLGPE